MIEKKIKLFCIPYAGGSSDIYNKWNEINKGIEVIPIELAGRGSRFCEPLYANLKEAVNDVYNKILEKLDEAPYAIFGHSMGALIAYEIYWKLLLNKNKLPIHIYFSGIRPPSSINLNQCHRLSNNEFKKKIFNLGGTPKEFFDIPELMDVFIPILRADFEIVETYEYNERQNKIIIPVSVLHGIKDDIDIQEIYKWQKDVEKKVDFYIFDGGHFFINEKMQDVIKMLKETLSKFQPFFDGERELSIMLSHKQ